MGELTGFIPANVDPSFGGAGFLPVSDDKGWLVIITSDNGFKPASTGQGMYRELAIKAGDGPVAGKEAVLRLNLQHTSPTAVTAALAQLSALCHVTGVMNPNDFSDLINRPFRVVSELQDSKKPDGYTQLANNGIRDVNGNKPGGKAGATHIAQPGPGTPIVQGAPGPGGTFVPTGAPPANGGGAPAGWGAPTGQPAPAVQPQGQPAAWGAPQGQPPAGQPTPTGQPPAWGAPQGQPAQGQGGAPAWTGQA